MPGLEFVKFKYVSRFKEKIYVCSGFVPKLSKLSLRLIKL